MLRPAIATVSLGRSLAGHGIIKKLRQAGIAGYQGVEIFFECLEDLARQKQNGSERTFREALIEASREVREACDVIGLVVVALQPFTNYGGLLEKEAHRQKIETLAVWFEICHILNTDAIQIPTNFLTEGTTGDFDRIVADMSLVAKLGLEQSPSIRFAYEGISWGTHIDTWEGTWEIVKHINLPNLGLCLDTFHITGRVWGDPASDTGKTEAAEEALEESLGRLVKELDPRKIFHVQLSDAERLQPPLSRDHPLHVADQKPRMTWSRNARLFPFESDRGAYLPVWRVCQAIFVEMKWQGWASMEMFGRTLYDRRAEVPLEHASRAAHSWSVFSEHVQAAFPPANVSTANVGIGLVQDSYRYGLSHFGPICEKPNRPRNGVLFGHPISHALSPQFHKALWKRLGLPWKFLSVDSMEIHDLLVVLKSSDCVGASITMPHKISCMSIVDEVTEEARATGAINTIFIRTDAHKNTRKYVGTNTDIIGIREALERSFPGIKHRVRSKTGLVIGGGGTARTSIYALWRSFALREIYLVNRPDTELEQIVLSMRAELFPAKITPVKTVETAAQCETPMVVVGAVPDIPAKTGSEFQAKAVTTEFLKKLKGKEEQEGFLLDMCYQPNTMTSLLKLGLANGWQTVSGVEAVVHQCVAQDILWLETPIDHAGIEEASTIVRAASSAN